MDNNSANNSKKAANKPSGAPQFDHSQLVNEQNQATENYSQSTAADNQEPQTNIYSQSNPLPPNTNAKASTTKPWKIFAAFCMACFAVIVFFKILQSSPRVDTSIAARDALNTGVSQSLSAGTLLLRKDEVSSAKDYTITHNSDQETTKILVWDYAAEDGDYVQILVNGTPITDAFMIKNKPIEILVPAVGTVQVKGVRDGGGGITYAVFYAVNKTIYFNSAPQDSFNTYTLIRQP